MDSDKLSGNTFQQRLDSVTKDLGEPIVDSEVKQRLENLWKTNVQNTFYFLVDIREPAIIHAHRVLPVLGYSNLDIVAYFGLIHPSYRYLYMEFGASAYLQSIELASQAKDLPQTYTIQFPILTAENGYYWVNQISDAIYFDERGRMVVYLNTYQLFRPYHNEGPSRPMLVFPNLNLTHDFHDVHETVLKPWLSEFTPLEKTLVFTYWRLSQENKSATIEEIAEQLGWSRNQVTNRNKSVKKKAESAFPVSEFRQASDVGLTLYRLFGEIPK